jgi:hypothetical protein
MSISALRTAITSAGGTPTQYGRTGLLRELITAWGGTPTYYDEVNLLRQAITTVGGTPTQYERVALMRELVTELGGTPATYEPDALMAQVAANAARFGPELVVDGTFTNTVNWVEGAGWTIGAGADAVAASSFNYQLSGGLTAGRTYRITMTISNYSAGSVQGYIGAAAAFTTARSANGTFVEDVVATSTGELGLLGAAFTGKVASLSVKEKL